MTPQRTSFITALFCAAGAAALPAPALADGESAYVQRNANTLGFFAYANHDNDVSVTMDGNYVVFKDASGPILSSNGCQPVTGGGARCLIAAPTHLSVGLGNGANEAVSNLPDDDLLSITISAGGDSTQNRIEHIGRPATLNGGPGPDTIIGGLMADELNGNAGADILQPRGGKDAVNGGADVDMASYADHLTGPVRVSLDNQANDGYTGEGDNVKTENVTGGARGDFLTGSSATNVLNGGAGGDRISGEGGSDQLNGGVDGDVLDGGAGEDTENGGSGDDRFLASPGADRLIGSLGFDTTDYSARSSPVAVDLDGQADDGGEAEGDNAQVEHVTGGQGGDVIVGNSAANVLRGGPGADRLEGLAGKDALYGEAGADDMRARDGVAELVDCGADADTFDVDQGDQQVACASDTQGGGTTPGGGPGKAPKLVISPRRPRLAGKLITLRVQCPRTADVACTGVMRLKRGKATVGSKRFRIAAGKSSRVRIRVARRTRSAVLDSGSLRVSLKVVVRDADSSPATSTRRLRLLQPRR